MIISLKLREEDVVAAIFVVEGVGFFVGVIGILVGVVVSAACGAFVGVVGVGGVFADF